MEVSKASVCVAIQNLREGGYISMNEEYEISLTEEGKQIAETICERHLLVSQVLESLGVDQKNSDRRCLPYGTGHQSTHRALRFLKII